MIIRWTSSGSRVTGRSDFDDHGTEGNIRYEMTVHHIDVDTIRAGTARPRLPARPVV